MTVRYISELNSAADSPILIEFGRLVQNDMPSMKQMLKSKLEVEFQYVDCLFSKTGNSNISAVD